MKNRDLDIRNTVKFHDLKLFLSSLSTNTQFLFTHFGTINASTVDTITRKEMARHDKIKFFAHVDGILMAYGFLTKFEKKTKKHNCILGIVIDDEWQDKGIGSMVCKYMINSAWKKGFTKIWLTVYSDNKRAIHVYRSLGFEIEGIFMNDEIISKKRRHVVSMAIFKGKGFSYKQRINLWNRLQRNS